MVLKILYESKDTTQGYVITSSSIGRAENIKPTVIESGGWPIGQVTGMVPDGWTMRTMEMGGL